LAPLGSDQIGIAVGIGIRIENAIDADSEPRGKGTRGPRTRAEVASIEPQAIDRRRQTRQ
jgi:hypothetical protein